MVTLILAVVCCGMYPLVVFGVSKSCFTTRPMAVCSWAGMARSTARA